MKNICHSSSAQLFTAGFGVLLLPMRRGAQGSWRHRQRGWPCMDPALLPPLTRQSLTRVSKVQLFVPRQGQWSQGNA